MSLVARYLEEHGIPTVVFGCARDIVEQVVDICRYQDREPVITRELLDAACSSYFIEESMSQGNEA